MRQKRTTHAGDAPFLSPKQDGKIEDEHIDKPNAVKEHEHARQFGDAVKGKGDGE